jgi:hypothetical protein
VSPGIIDPVDRRPCATLGVEVIGILFMQPKTVRGWGKVRPKLGVQLLENLSSGPSTYAR